MKMNFFKNGKLSGKGTAAVICFCLAAVAALGIFSYNRSANELNQELSGIVNNSRTEGGEVSSPAADANAPAEVPYTEADAPQESIILEHDGLTKDDNAENSAPAETGQAADEASGDNVNVNNTVVADGEVISDVDADHNADINANAGISDAVVRPVSGEVLNAFSGGELVKSKTLDVWKTHDGIDVAADSGSDVRSMTSGTVRSVNVDPLMGVTVVIDHGSGYEGYYCNLAADVNVTEGDNVSAGSVIGTVGNTAESEIAEASHLHFGLKKNGSWTDPAEVLSTIGS